MKTSKLKKTSLEYLNYMPGQLDRYLSLVLADFSLGTQFTYHNISNFMKSRKLQSLGMPTYHGGGSHTYKGENYRYLVLERYGKDIWSLFRENNRSFPATTAFQLGLQMLDVLEYIHSRGYVHADVKGANILLGYKKGTENQAYLLDFGLAKKVSEKEFKPDPKCAHNGTIEYTSRDAHLGVSTLRGDLEILGYNILQWIVGELPWEKSLQDPKKVQQLKEDFMSNIKKNITKNYPSVPGALIEFFENINALKPKETPNYSKFRSLFEAYLKCQGCTRSSMLNFKTSKKPKTTKAARSSIRTVEDGSSDSENIEKSVKKPRKTTKIQKRKSTEPVLLTAVKKTKLNPRVSATPPAKQNHANIATQTSVDKVRKSPRSVTIDSPASDGRNVKNGRSVKVPNYNESTPSSPDVFEDSLEVKPKKKRGLLAEQKVTVTRKTVKKTVKTGRSWKDAPTIMNGRRPPA